MRWSILCSFALLWLTVMLVDATLFAAATKQGVFICSSTGINRGGIRLHHNFKWLRPLGRDVLIGFQVFIVNVDGFCVLL